MSTYKHIVEHFNRLVQGLVKFSGLETGLVENVVRFCQCLAKPGENTIDQQIYFLVLSTYLNFVDQAVTGRIYDRIAYDNPDNQITMEDFARILCTFFCDDLDLKIDHVYSVYDYNRDGFIDHRKVAEFMRACWCISDVDESDKDETVFDLSVMACELLGIRGGVTDPEVMTLEDFRAKVKEKPLMLTVLCQALPPHDAVDRFRQKLTGKSNLEMKEIYGNIRVELLYEMKNEKRYYPILLDIP